MPRPSTIRYLRNEQQVWMLVRRLFPKAVKELDIHKQQIKNQLPNNITPNKPV